MAQPVTTITRSFGIYSVCSREALLEQLRHRYQDRMVVLACPRSGVMVIYPSVDKLPARSVRCPCGAADCWTVYYASESEIDPQGWRERELAKFNALANETWERGKKE